MRVVTMSNHDVMLIEETIAVLEALHLLQPYGSLEKWQTHVVRLGMLIDRYKQASDLNPEEG